MYRQPRLCVTRPPNSALTPDPPQEPIDQRLIARWRAAPFQYVFTSANSPA